MVVLGNAQQDDNGAFRVVAGTTDFSKPIADNELYLPSIPYPKRHPYTRLCRETVVACDWIVRIQETDILDYGGFLPDSTYWDLRMKMQEIFGTDDPDATVTHVPRS